jgi:hypothetical protein
VRTEVVTFGRVHVRGQAFDELSRAETRAQQQAPSAAIDDALLEVLATSIAEATDRDQSIADSHLAFRRAEPGSHFFWPL